jgi:hypothetical protein
MEKIALNQITLLDPQGHNVLLTEYFNERLLLVFHRHLA